MQEIRAGLFIQSSHVQQLTSVVLVIDDALLVVDAASQNSLRWEIGVNILY